MLLLLMAEEVRNEMEQNHSFADYGQTVRDMNKYHKTDPTP